MAKSKKRSVDVRSKKDVSDFEKTLSIGPITLVLVYADWCGHCQNFKKDIWNGLQNMPNKKINLASVHYDQLPNTSQKDAKINGYPSLLVIGNDKKPASFNVEGEEEVTNALPDSRNKEMLEKMVTSDPETLPEVLNANTNVVESVNVNTPQKTLNFQPETLTKRNQANTMNVSLGTNIPPENYTVLPPNTTIDRLPTENEFINNFKKNVTANGTMTENEFNTAMKQATTQKGGSLLNTLIKMAQVTAPATLLVGAAAFRTKRKSRKSKKSKKRMTRRR